MPKIEKLSYLVNPQMGIVPASVTTGAVTAVAVDASGGFDRVCHIITVGAFTTGGTFDAEITQCDTSGGTYTLIASSGMVALTAASASKVILIDVPVSGSKPYQKIRATVAKTVLVGAVSICYNGTRPLGTAMSDVVEEVFVA